MVWSEERGFYPSKLAYGSNVGAPAIIPEDISSWKNEKILKANSYYKKRFDELLDEYKKLQEELEWLCFTDSKLNLLENIISESAYT